MIEGGVGICIGIAHTLIEFGLIWYGIRSVFNGTLSPGSLLAFFMAFGLITGPISAFVYTYVGFQSAAGAMERVFALLDSSPEPVDESTAAPFPQGKIQVDFENVCFEYTLERQVLTEFSLHVPAGKVTALVGPSGVGKTTAAILLLR